jgi:hypothetical protein
MSTKTTFKRLALVAVAALGLGVLSVAPSQATTIANKVTPSATTSAIKVGETATITLAVSTILTSNTESLSVTGVRTKGTSGELRLSPTTDSVSTGVKQTAKFDPTIWVDTSTAAGGAAYAVVQADFRAPAAAGTYEVTFYSAGTGAGTAITPFTWTITVTADSKLSDSSSTSFIANGHWTKLVDADDVAVGSKATSATIAATIKVTQKNATASATEAMQIYVTGPGFVTAGGADTTTATSRVTTRVASATAPAVGASTYFGVWSDGTAGEATVTVVGADSGLVLASKKVTFSDTKPASATAVVKKAYIAAGASTDKVFAVTVKDAAGNAITGTSVTVTGTRADTTTAGKALATADVSFTWDSTDKVYYSGNVTGASTSKFGPAAYIISVKGTDAAETVVTTTATTTFADVIATSVTITAPATAAIGDKVTYTLTAKEKNGYPIADGSYEGGSANGSRGIFWNTTATAVPTYTSTSVKPFNAGETITTVSGVATVDIYMPVAAGSVGATWTLAGSATSPIGAIDKTIGGTTITVATTVTNPGVDAASDAANEATDAANAATDAALAAADAADAATAAAADASAAVAKLAKSVNKQLAALKKQLTSLIALVNKLR